MNSHNLGADSVRFHGRRSIVVLLVSAGLLSGCLSTRYKMAGENTPAPVLLNLVATQPPLEAALNLVVIYQGPGAWKQAAFWDEYVVTLRNQGDQPLTIAAAALADPVGASIGPGANPWALERQSKTLEDKYRDAGVAFVRSAGAGLVIAGAGAGIGAATYTATAGGFGIGAAGAGAVAAGAATVVVMPVYFLAVKAFNNDNKAAIVTEFGRRRLALPLTLAPGETRIGSLFFPMIPSPRTLTLRWSGGASSGELALALDSLKGLHLKEPVTVAASR